MPELFVASNPFRPEWKWGIHGPRYFAFKTQDDLLTRLWETDPHPIVIHGLPQSGVTSRIADIDREFQTVYVTLRQIDGQHALRQDLAKRILEELARLDNQSIDIDGLDIDQILGHIDKRIDSQLGIGDSRLAIIIDDFDLAVANLHVNGSSEATFRRLVRRIGWHKRVVLGFAGHFTPGELIRIERLVGSRNSFTQNTFGPNRFTRVETSEYLQTALLSVNLFITRQGAHRVYQHTRGQPYLIWSTGNRLVDTYNQRVNQYNEAKERYNQTQNPADRPDPIFSEEALLDVWKQAQFRAQAETRLFQPLLAFATRIDPILPNILRFVARFSFPVPRSDIQGKYGRGGLTSLAEAETAGLIRNDNGWRIAIPLFRDYLRGDWDA